jgi:alkane 1-monooxygenase
MATAKFWTPFAFLALVVVGARLGGAWSFLLVAALPLALTVGDWAFGDDRPSPSPGGGRAHRLLPWLYVPAQLAVMVWAGWTVAQPSTPLLGAVALTLSTGLSAGVFGFLAAHELVHSRHTAERAWGLLMLAALLDMRFSISHVRGHHWRAATWPDPATARKGESFYAFLVRSVVGQWREAWALEAHRLRRAGRALFGRANLMVGFTLMEGALLVAVALCGWRALAFFLADAVLAKVLLEGFNYVAHYGLSRGLDAEGRLEPLRPRHSWSTARRANNAALFNMGRHADHHRFSGRSYHELELMEGGAELPCGYAGVLLLAIVPPLWFAVMDPLVDATIGAGASSVAPRHDALDSATGLAQFPRRPSRERPSLELGAEGATAPETLRQMDRAGL